MVYMYIHMIIYIYTVCVCIYIHIRVIYTQHPECSQKSSNPATRGEINKSFKPGVVLHEDWDEEIRTEQLGCNTLQ